MLGVNQRIDISPSVRFVNVVLMAQAFSVPGNPGLKMIPLIFFRLNRSYIVMVGVLTGYHMEGYPIESTLSTQKRMYYWCRGLVRRKTVIMLFLEASKELHLYCWY